MQRIGQHTFETENLFVIFTAFEPVARVEANESVTDQEINRLKKELNDDDLWEISRLFDSVTFFFYTDEQVKDARQRGVLGKYSRKYSKIVEKYDEFGYHKIRPVSASLDSKENFDTNFQSNWYYYYK